jgi:hypothetical protein
MDPTNLHRSAREAHGTRGSRPSWVIRSFKAVGRFLTLRLRIRRRGLQFSLLISQPRGNPRPLDPATQRRREALRRDFKELHTLLSADAQARRSMPYLSYVERTFAREGSRGLSKVPVPMLEKALEQLSDLVQRPQGMKLNGLRARLANAIDALAHQRHEVQTLPDVEVSEATHSVFAELERNWTAPMPLSEVPQQHQAA